VGHVIILATQEAEIKRIEVGRQPGQIVPETLSQKKPFKKRAGGMAQGVSPEAKLQYWRWEWRAGKLYTQ
jgi:hypothetical protein